MKNIKTYTASLNEAEEQELLDMRLTDAAEEGNLDMVKQFLNTGANVDSINPYSGMSALQLAAYKGHNDIIDQLLDAGAKINLKDSDGWTALHHARGKAALVAKLLDRGAGIDEVDAEGNAALHHASFRGEEDVVKHLLDRGAEIDRRNANGSTPLSETKPYGNIGTAKLLVLRGADPFKAFDGPEEIIEFFGRDLDWMPEGPMKDKIRRIQQEEDLFGSDF